MIPKKDVVTEIRKALPKGASIEELLDHLLNSGIVSDRSARDYVLRQRFWAMRKDPDNRERSDGDIMLDLSSYCGLCVESVWRIVHRGANRSTRAF